MKKILWKVRYANHLRKRLGISFIQCFRNAESALENIDYDLSECAIDCADEEYYAWASDCVN